MFCARNEAAFSGKAVINSGDYEQFDEQSSSLDTKDTTLAAFYHFKEKGTN